MVIIVDKGSWHQDDTLQLSTYSNSVLDSRVMGHRIEEGPRERTVTVALTTLDSIVDDLKPSKVDFIKMDIEGEGTGVPAGFRGVSSETTNSDAKVAR